MNNKLRAIYRIIILPIVIVVSIIYLNNPAYGEGSEGGSDGTWLSNCGIISSRGWCWGTPGKDIRWIKAPISVFKQIYDNPNHDWNGWYSNRAEISTCQDPSKNTSGWVAFVGYYGYGLSMNTSGLQVRNITTGSLATTAQRKKSEFNLSFTVNENGENISTNIFDEEVSRIYNGVIEKGYNTWSLAVFCPTMVEKEVPYTLSYESQTRSRASGNSWNPSTSPWNKNAAEYYVPSSNNDKTETTFYFQHQLKISGCNPNGPHCTNNRPTRPNWDITRYVNTSNQGIIDAGQSPVGDNWTNISGSTSPSITISSIPLGTKKEVCQNIKHSEKVDVVDSYSANTFVGNKSMVYSSSSKSSSSCATANHPYDFTTSASTNSVNPILYIGETIQASGAVKNSGTHDNNNATPHTITPSDTVSRLFQFTVNANVAADNNKLAGGTTSSDPCEFFRNKLGAGNVTCNGNLKSETTSIANGATKNLSGTINVPDNASFLGKKICIATAISYTDSGSGYNDGLNKKWRVSGASCSTIAKRPNFQVWGGVSTRGSINTAYSSKSGRTYGSWAEHLVVAGGVVNRFGSGASLGYATGSYNLSLPGGKNGTNPNTEDISLLTVSNSGNAIGKSNITTSSQLIESLKTRFSSASAGVEFTNSVDEFDGKIERLFGTKVYKIDDDVTIKNDICYGNCNGSPTKLESYNLSSNQPATIPQIIIFAKNIKINENVKRIDAWLISDNDIDTCNDHAVGNNNLSSSSCKETLIINGPVFAKSIQLKRTAGAESGEGTQEPGDVLQQDISNDGSIAPAEVFNLRGDAYIWSHMQAKRSNEAVTVYTRELAPRL